MEGTKAGDFLDGPAFGGAATGASAGALGLGGVLGRDLAGASDGGGEAELRGGGAEAGALEMGGAFGSAVGASGVVFEGLGLATGVTDFVAFLAVANATRTMPVFVGKTRSPTSTLS